MNRYQSQELYYDPHAPKTRRYITPDPIGLEGGINLYPYVGNDPVNNKDLEGLRVLPVPGAPGLPLPLPPVFIPGTPENKAWTDSVNKLFGKIGETISNVINGPWPGSGEKDKPEKWPPGDDWRGQCIRLYALCVKEKWSGNCGDCLNKCTAQHEWPFHDCSPDKECKR